MGNLVSFLSDYLSGVEEGDKWRVKASEEARLRAQAFEASQNAFRAGRKAEAKVLSDRGKQHVRNMEAYNKRAADAIYAAHNPAGDGSLAQVDLHGLHVQEALARAEAHIAACRKAGLKSTVVVTGRGNRSRDGLAKIKPAVGAFLKREKLRAELGVPNEGCVTVWFDAKEEEAGWGCVVM